MNSLPQTPSTIFNQQSLCWVGSFRAMASPCEILIDTEDESLAQRITQLAWAEAQRIEQKYSRYRDDNIVYQINHANGKKITVDEETARLLDYADTCYSLSEGFFDITSGILRRAWKFDGQHKIPSQAELSALLSKIGWNKVSWHSPEITMPPDMEIDFGGIGKEYAVDRTAQIIKQQTQFSHVLVNFGGDITTLGPRQNEKPWEIGLQHPEQQPGVMDAKIALHHGAVTTSGDYFRVIVYNNQRYGHIINPKTGWPPVNAPRQVTVVGNTCLEAGILSTLAILQGEDAETFLEAQGIEFRVLR